MTCGISDPGMSLPDGVVNPSHISGTGPLPDSSKNPPVDGFSDTVRAVFVVLLSDTKVGISGYGFCSSDGGGTVFPFPSTNSSSLSWKNRSL